MMKKTLLTISLISVLYNSFGLASGLDNSSLEERQRNARRVARETLKTNLDAQLAEVEKTCPGNDIAYINALNGNRQFLMIWCTPERTGDLNTMILLALQDKPYEHSDTFFRGLKDALQKAGISADVLK